jgi:hypothetical protein
MPKPIDPRQPIRLSEGYHLIRINAHHEAKAGSIRVKSEGSVCTHTEIAFKRGGLMLIRLRAPAKVWLCMGHRAIGRTPSLSHTKLWRLIGPYLKLTHRSRLNHRIPLLGEGGYICILSGIDDAEGLPRLREEMIAERALVRLGLDDGSIPDHELFDNPFGILPRPVRPWQPAFDKRGTAAIVLHLFYEELWPEFELFIGQMQSAFDLWVTHCGLADRSREQVLRAFPHAKIAEVENRGRDIWPFLSLLNAGCLNGYDYICKIHSKKSAHGGGTGESLLGSRWRRRALYDLLGFGRAEAILDMFERDPQLGLVGPQVLRLPNARMNLAAAWGSIKNRDNARQLALRMGAEMRDDDLKYFAGSMFWARPAALEALRQLDFKRDDFPEEGGQLDGELQHAIERAFSLSTIKAGLKLADAGPILQFSKHTLSSRMPA